MNSPISGLFYEGGDQRKEGVSEQVGRQEMFRVWMFLPVR